LRKLTLKSSTSETELCPTGTLVTWKG